MARFTNGPDATDNPANIQTRAATIVSKTLFMTRIFLPQLSVPSPNGVVVNYNTKWNASPVGP